MWVADIGKHAIQQIFTLSAVFSSILKKISVSWSGDSLLVVLDYVYKISEGEPQRI